MKVSPILSKNLKLSLLLFLLVGNFSCSSLQYAYKPISEKQSFDQFYQSKLEISKSLNARPGCEEKAIQYGPQKTKYSILYVHGWGACRKEGEFVVDALSQKYKLNTYYLRQPGHGTNIDDQLNTTFERYLQETEEAFLQTRSLGNKVIIIGTSMGGLLATYIASKYPNDIHAVILVSPFYDYADKASVILDWPGGSTIVRLLMGEYRLSGNLAKNPNPRLSPDYGKYWYEKAYFKSVKHLNDVKNYISKKDTFEKITEPVLLFYYYENEQNQDRSASVQKMHDAFAVFPKTKESREVNIPDGAHVLFSEFVRTDKKKIQTELYQFLDELDSK